MKRRESIKLSALPDLGEVPEEQRQKALDEIVKERAKKKSI
jgi:hypothetical protein